MRLVRHDGNIAESTQKDGKWHGLERWIINGQVHIHLYQNNHKIAYFDFDKWFEPGNRWDPQNLLKDL